MKFNWITPKTNFHQNISATIEKVYLGMRDDEIINNDNIKNYYTINVPIISMNVYKEICKYFASINNIINNNTNKERDQYAYKYLKFSKQTKTIKKIDKRNAYRFSLTICPKCKYSNCVECNKLKFKKYMENYKNIFHQKCFLTDNNNFPRYIKCHNCFNIFSTKGKIILYKCLGYQCLKCEKKFSNLYGEYLIYYHNNNNKNNNTKPSLRNILNKHYGDVTLSRKKKIIYIYESCLSEEAKKQIRYDYNTLYFHLKVEREEDKQIIIIPPLAFFIDMNKNLSFYMKLLLTSAHHLDVKSQYGSANSRAQGGKNSFYRKDCLTKRYASSARIVIVPRQSLKPDECILPISVYEALNCPKHVLCHRYPTLDIRSMTYHKVVNVWKFPTLAISTAIVSGNNADFDGDCIHVIPATNLMSVAELIILCHPKWNMIVQNQLRLHFDHDEIETIYSHFGLTRDEIHKIIYNIAKYQSQSMAYNIFCDLKRYCEWVWTFQGDISTITFKHFLEIIEKNGSNVDFDEFANDIFPKKISPNNNFKKMILSKASRFSINHLWQIFGYINEDVKEKGGFLSGMSKSNFIKMALLSRGAMINLSQAAKVPFYIPDRRQRYEKLKNL